MQQRLSFKRINIKNIFKNFSIKNIDTIIIYVYNLNKFNEGRENLVYCIRRVH